MKKKKSFITLLVTFCLIIPAMFMLTACGSDTLTKLTNNSGFVVEGGDFVEGSVLEANVIDSTSDEYEDALTLIASQSYDNTKPVYVFDISVKKDNVKIQPKGKVKVSVPVSADLTGYDVLHIKSDNTIERLTVTYKNGTATFETDSFSTFVFVATGIINPIQTAGSEAEWNNAINYWQAQNNVKVVERISSPDDGWDTGAQIMVYQLDGTAYNEDGYFERAEESKNKGKGYYIVKEGDKYSRYESYDEGTTWYKTSAGDMTNQLKRTVYGCLDLEDNLIDFSYTRFNYDSSSNTYKYKANENIAVKFEFINGSIDKIIITRYRTSYETTFVRTITFGNADVDVPTTNVIDATVSE